MIRFAQMTDLPWLRRLHEAFCAEFQAAYPTTDMEELDHFVLAVSQSLRGDSTFCLVVAEDEGQLVGYLGAGVMRRAVGKPAQVATPFWLYVTPRVRSRGFGRALAGAAVAWLREQWPQVTTIEIPSRAHDAQWSLRGFKPFLVYHHGPLSLADDFIAGKRTVAISDKKKRMRPKRPNGPLPDTVNAHE